MLARAGQTWLRDVLREVDRALDAEGQATARSFVRAADVGEEQVTLAQLLAIRLIGKPAIGTSALRVAAVGMLLVISRALANELYECGPRYGRAAKVAEDLWSMARTLQTEMESVSER